MLDSQVDAPVFGVGVIVESEIARGRKIVTVRVKVAKEIPPWQRPSEGKAKRTRIALIRSEIGSVGRNAGARLVWSGINDIDQFADTTDTIKHTHGGLGLVRPGSHFTLGIVPGQV